MSTITHEQLAYTDFDLTTDVRITETPRNPYATGYGPKIPTGTMIEYDGRWRRVYAMCYGNGGSIYLIHKGETCYIDLDTQWFIDLYLEEIHAEEAKGRGH